MDTQKLLEEYMLNFFWYWNLKSKIWFVGMEEWSSGDPEEIIERIRLWEKQGMRNTLDVKLFHQELYEDYFFNNENDDNIKSQATWRWIIRVILWYLWKDDDIKSVKRYQNNELWKLNNGDNCILELFPLPSVNITDADFHTTYQFHLKEWFFKENNIVDKSGYKTVLKAKRIDKLNEFITINKPENIIFYWMSYYDYWSEIIPWETECFQIKTWRGSETREIYYFKWKETNFYIVPHTTAIWLTKIFFKELWKFIKTSYFNKII